MRQACPVGAKPFGQVLDANRWIKEYFPLFHRFLQVSQYPPLLFVGNNLDIVRSGFHECVFLLFRFEVLVHQLSVGQSAVDEQDQEHNVRDRQDS